ncbi:cytochrome c biogenesis protein ResB [Streptomyces javensis]|uniref:Cytochrome c biogenesis protein ResB n=1 Tax=Streptomyces javensis TaxID=114698 RepID=A0ABS0RKN8_9ACTN|nr:cytochrome c biogenesis protein ResB [Streptomyces javensis]MBI0317530.1 cytochrome c biogenesis protein ResB [Streptomyces javensis]
MSTTDTDTAAGKEAGPPPEGGATAEERELGAAGSQLSTAPAEEINVPSLGPLGWARWFWRQLTSMRVALLLLLLLTLATIPGSLVPQTSIDQLKVQDFQERHPTLTPIYEKLQLFHVYSSVWFSAIYLLLFISLIGCIVPRTWQFIGQLRGRPPAAPRRLTRLPAYTTWRSEAEPEQVLAAARKIMRGRRFRVETSGDAVAAEKGYLREVGNLLFHTALIVLLVSFAAGQLWKTEGSSLITEGGGFSNSLTQYDDIKTGQLFNSDDLAPFGFQLDRFTATYERSGPQMRTPRTFRADVSYWDGADGASHKTSIKVNEPLEIQGYKVFLLNHGYSPVVTIRDGKGDVVHQGPVVGLPIDGANLTESMVIKVPDYRDKNGKKDQIGFQGQFLPTWVRSQGMFSVFPALDNPTLVLTAYHGSLGVDGGTPQSVYQLDKSRMKQFMEPDGKTKFARALKVGDTMKLPNGAGTLSFDGVKEWASFQISHKPGDQGALIGAVAALVGLAASLFIQRRRVWVRAVRGEDGATVVEMAGLGRSEYAKLPEELADLAVRLQADAPPAPEAEPDPEPDRNSTKDSGKDSTGDSGKDSAKESSTKESTEDSASESASDTADPADPAEGARA